MLLLPLIMAVGEGIAPGPLPDSVPAQIVACADPARFGPVTAQQAASRPSMETSARAVRRSPSLDFAWQPPRVREATWTWAPGIVSLQFESASLWTPPPAAPGSVWGSSWVSGDVGLRATARWAKLRVYADQQVHFDVVNADAGGLARLRLSERHRLGVRSTPSQRLNLGVEVSRRPGRGLDPLPGETRANARLELRFP